MKIDITASTNALKLTSLKHAGLTGKALELISNAPLTQQQKFIQVKHKTVRELITYLVGDFGPISDTEIYNHKSLIRNKVLVYLVLDIIGNTSIEFFLDNSDTRMNWANKLNNGKWEKNSDNIYWNACKSVIFDEFTGVSCTLLITFIKNDIVFSWNVKDDNNEFSYNFPISMIMDTTFKENLPWWLNLCKLALHGITSNIKMDNNNLMTKIDNDGESINIVTEDTFLINWNNLYNEIFSSITL